MKIAVLVLSNDNICECSRCARVGRSNSFGEMVKSIRKTWGSEKVNGIDVYYIYGHRNGVTFKEGTGYIETNERYWPIPKGDGGTPVDITKKRRPFAIDDCIYSDTPEDYSNIYYKTIDGFQWLLENTDFDYVLRTNCGTYIDLEILKKFVDSHGIKDNLYAGGPMTCGRTGVRFASGSAFLASRNLIEDLVKKRNEIQHVRSPYASATIVDDVTFAKVFDKQITPFTKIDFHSTDVIMRSDAVKGALQCYFLHNIDPNLMYAVHEKKGKRRTD